MPFKSEKQRKFMWAKHPKIAEKWAHESRPSKKQMKKNMKKSHGSSYYGNNVSFA